LCHDINKLSPRLYTIIIIIIIIIKQENLGWRNNKAITGQRGKHITSTHSIPFHFCDFSWICLVLKLA